MCEDGGIYMDVDTIPPHPAIIFLMKPEVPDYCHRQGADGGGAQNSHHVRWMNLFLDETGMIDLPAQGCQNRRDVRLCLQYIL